MKINEKNKAFQISWFGWNREFILTTFIYIAPYVSLAVVSKLIVWNHRREMGNWFTEYGGRWTIWRDFLKWIVCHTQWINFHFLFCSSPSIWPFPLNPFTFVCSTNRSLRTFDSFISSASDCVTVDIGNSIDFLDLTFAWLQFLRFGIISATVTWLKNHFIQIKHFFVNWAFSL